MHVWLDFTLWHVIWYDNDLQTIVHSIISCEIEIIAFDMMSCFVMYTDEITAYDVNMHLWYVHWYIKDKNDIFDYLLP